MKRLIRNLRQQESLRQALKYLWRYLTTRGPAALRRRVNARGDLVEVRRDASRWQGVRLGVLVSGGIGDHVLAARFMRDLRAQTEPFAFDVYSANPSVARWVFSSVDGFDRCALDVSFEGAAGLYALAFVMSPILTVHGGGAGGSRPEAIGPALWDCVGKIRAFSCEVASLMVPGQGRMDGVLAQKLQFRNMTRATCAHGLAGVRYGGDVLALDSDRSIVTRLGLDRNEYVTVHNGFEAQYVTARNRATKCYPHFDEVVALLKRQFADVCFVQVGSSTSAPIASTDINLISATSLREASALIRGAVAHLDNESGLVHIASCYSVPCCVVFGPTPADYFGYSGNINLRPRECGSCWWATEAWMDRCPRGFAEPVCTYTQPPLAVAEAMGAMITSRIRGAVR